VRPSESDSQSSSCDQTTRTICSKLLEKHSTSGWVKVLVQTPGVLLLLPRQCKASGPTPPRSHCYLSRVIGTTIEPELGCDEQQPVMLS
jgi:hypothetical protein